MRISEFITRATKALSSTSSTPRLDSELLLCNALKKERAWLFTWPEYSLTAVEEKQAGELLARRCAGEPVAYIIKQKYFWSLSLKVNRSTLIPGPDTDRVVELALDVPVPATARVLDLGTGSGAIALSLAKEHPEWKVTGVDYQPGAVRLAQENAVLNHITNAVFFQSNWFDQVYDTCFDLIVSNPPYIDKDDPHLQQGDLRFEPATALVAADRGLQDIRHIVTHAPNYLVPGGWLICEHGYQQCQAVKKIFLQNGFQCIETFTDLSGHERVTMGKKTDE